MRIRRRQLRHLPERAEEKLFNFQGPNALRLLNIKSPGYPPYPGPESPHQALGFPHHASLLPLFPLLLHFHLSLRFSTPPFTFQNEVHRCHPRPCRRRHGSPLRQPSTPKAKPHPRSSSRSSSRRRRRQVQQRPETDLLRQGYRFSL